MVKSHVFKKWIYLVFPLLPRNKPFFHLGDSLSSLRNSLLIRSKGSFQLPSTFYSVKKKIIFGYKKIPYVSKYSCRLIRASEVTNRSMSRSKKQKKLKRQPKNQPYGIGRVTLNRGDTTPHAASNLTAPLEKHSQYIY